MTEISKKQQHINEIKQCILDLEKMELKNEEIENQLKAYNKILYNAVNFDEKIAEVAELEKLKYLNTIK